MRAARERRERRIAQKAIEESQAQLTLIQSALQAAANAIVITDKQGVIIWVNAAFSELTGYAAHEVWGQTPRLLKSGKQSPEFYKQLWDTVLAGKVWRAEMVNRRKDGSLYTEANTITPVRDRNGSITHFIAVKQDVTDRRTLEAQLRQAQKMEAIGQIAGGVAHDFNNMIAVMRGNADLLLMEAEQCSAQTKECLKQIVAAAERAANLTRQLLIFSRKQSLQPRPVRLNELVGNLTKMLKRVIREDVDLEVKCAPDLPLVEADAGMIEQVVLNLVINARDAMPRGGRLTITTERVVMDEAAAKVNREARTGEFVALSVSDTGTGIAAEHLPRLFEPFFTTKEPGRGTGLGLATAYGIIKQHQGWFEVSSRLGAGATFRVLLPTVPPSVPTPVAAPKRVELRGGSETILLVEDDYPVRLLLRQILENYHYSVQEACCAREAVALWRNHPQGIDLLLTDIVLPEAISGRELAAQLRQRSPDLKVIFMSGYQAEAAGSESDLPRRPVHTRFLQKPASTELLLQTVRELLDDERNAPNEQIPWHTHC